MNEKIENILNLSMAVDSEMIYKSRELQIGYDRTDNTWDLILRYRGNGTFLFEYDNNAKILSGGYALVNVNENRIDELAGEERVLFAEKPKALFFEVTNGIRVSCVTPLQNNYGLYGKGTIAGIIDSGIDYYNNAFIDENGKSRILEIWDQTRNDNENSFAENGNEGFLGVGRIITQEQINESINENNRENAITVDTSGHGTHVAGIMAGNFARDKRNNIGIATKSEIVVVKLNDSKNGFFRTTELMLAIEYLANKAEYYNKPMAINISFGNNYGSHDGTSLLETYIDYMCDREGISVVVGSG
ncbi:MAG: S8 family serine peptidase [Lachnospiraceae bacterium]|nr:S8 family serine peptidase [Lachnospiraceae bacterium]